ncbi:MAG TPA: hypothetical protein DHN29_16000 [Cytophagales bacterium]|nr:hypothetical protein [Cytophagales bacterium]|tara:strand:+ start:1993 stop:2763 length:771 start_codon:yes stop_codon:yes gene_type:complete
MSKHVVIPDAHAHPGDDFERFELAGRFVLQERPDVVISMGDWSDMPSLCSYDMGRKSYEGRRYVQDVDASRQALAAFNAPIEDYNSRRRHNKVAQYKPRKVMLYGNHEDRIARAIELDAKLEGTIALEDLGYEEYGWETQPYLIPIEIDGVYYNHYFVSGVMGNPISGENPAKTICKKQMASCTAAHTHIRDDAVVASPDGRQVYGLVAGCYFEHSVEYARAVEHLYWRGLFVKHNVHNGEYDLESYGFDRLRKVV